MALERFLATCTGSCCQTLDESVLRQGSVAVLVPVCEEMLVWRWVVDEQVVVESLVRVAQPLLTCPEHIFAFDWGNLGSRYVEDHDFDAVAIGIFTKVGCCDVSFWVEGIKTGDSKLAYSGDSVEAGG
jgi:hypothetical protein